MAQLIPTGAQYDEAYFVSEVMYHLQMENRKKMWFEARIKLPAIADDMSILVGLGDSTLLAGTSTIEESANPDFIESRDFVGFVSFTNTSQEQSQDRQEALSVYG